MRAVWVGPPRVVGGPNGLPPPASWFFFSFSFFFVKGDLEFEFEGVLQLQKL